MNNNKFDVNTLRVASPCSVSWESMTGNERVRRCNSCETNIYNTAAMTKAEVERLILKNEGRLCIRLHKRADGTVITKDCPNGLRAFRKRTARFAGATLTAILGLFSASFGQKSDNSTGTSEAEIKRTISPNSIRRIVGIITDTNGAVVPGADIQLYKKGVKKPVKTTSDENGNYTFDSVSSGIYELKFKSPGFTTHIVDQIEVKNNETVSINISLKPGGVNVIVGIFSQEPMIDITSSTVTTTITRKKIEKIPH